MIQKHAMKMEEVMNYMADPSANKNVATVALKTPEDFYALLTKSGGDLSGADEPEWEHERR